MKKTFTLLFVICSATICAAQNWIQLTVPTTADIKSSSFISDHEGWIGTDNSGQAYIHHTADSGTTWNAIAVTGGSGGTSYVCFVSSSVGYVVVNTMAFKTVDGGNTWDPLTIPGVPYYTPYFFNTDTGFINGDGEVYKTTDGGGTWSIHEAGAFARIHFLNDNIGCASENEGDIYITVDGGVTWIYYQTGELIDHIYSAWYKQNGQLVYCGHLGSGPFSIANLEGTSEKYVNEDFETLYDVRFFGNDYGY
ncbi:MAG TPA: YCF48-related protein, partial [Chitinophagales bacterium]|nr:YCF48-related protein [Chitinophagales bacterium]